MQRGERYEAIKAGRSTYYTGLPCSKGHVTSRYTKNSACIDCVKSTASEFALKNKQRLNEIKESLDTKTCEIFLYIARQDYPALKLIMDAFLVECCPELSEILINPKEFHGKQVADGIFRISVRVPHSKISQVMNIAKTLLAFSQGEIKRPTFPIVETKEQEIDLDNI